MERERQRMIDFSRGEQLTMLRTATIPRGKKANDGGTVRPSLLKLVLKLIDDHGGGREAFLSYATIAKEANCSTRTARRSIEILQRLSLLVCQKKRTRSGAACNHYRIVWTELALLVNGHVASETNNVASETNNVASETNNVAIRGHRSAYEAQNETNKETRPRSAAGPLDIPASLAGSAEFSAAWRDWLSDRRERRLSTRDRTMRAQLESLAPLGPIAATECLRVSIRNGWQGIFPEKFKNGTKANTKRWQGSGQRFDPSANSAPGVGEM
jgi:hypothetical protein